MVFGFITGVLEMAEVRAACSKAPPHTAGQTPHRACAETACWGKMAKMPSQQPILFLYESAQQLKGLDEEPGGGEEHFVVLSRADEARCGSLWGVSGRHRAER